MANANSEYLNLVSSSMSAFNNDEPMTQNGHDWLGDIITSRNILSLPVLANHEKVTSWLERIEPTCTGVIEESATEYPQPRAIYHQYMCAGLRNSYIQRQYENTSSGHCECMRQSQYNTHLRQERFLFRQHYAHLPQNNYFLPHTQYGSDEYASQDSSFYPQNIFSFQSETWCLRPQYNSSLPQNSNSQAQNDIFSPQNVLSPSLYDSSIQDTDFLLQNSVGYTQNYDNSLPHATVIAFHNTPQLSNTK